MSSFKLQLSFVATILFILFSCSSAYAWPTNFRTTGCSSTTLTWAWQDNDAETKFRIDNQDDDSIVIDNIPANTTTTIETGLTPNTTYCRHVGAWWYDIWLGDSNAYEWCTLAALPYFTGNSYDEEPNGLGDILLQWNANGNPGGTNYYLQYDSNMDNNWASGATALYSGTSTSYNWNDQVFYQNSTYYFRLRAKNKYNVYTSWKYIHCKTDETTTFYWAGAAGAYWSDYWGWKPYPKYIVGSGPGVVGDANNHNRDIVCGLWWSSPIVDISDDLCVNDIVIYAGNSLTTGTGTFHITGQVSGAGSLTTGSGTLALSYVGDPLTLTGTLTATSGTTLYNGSGAQTIQGATYGALTLSGSGYTKTIDAATTVSNTCTVNSGVTLAANTEAKDFDFNGNVVLDGKISLSSGADILTMSGNVANSGSGGELYINHASSNADINGEFDIGTLTMTEGYLYIGDDDATITTVNCTDGTVYFDRLASQTIPAGNYFGMILSGQYSTKTFNGDLCVGASCSVSDDVTLNTGSGTVYIVGRIMGAGSATTGSGTLALGFVGIPLSLAGTFTATSGTVLYNASGSQTVRATTYNALTIDGSGTKTVDGTGTVNNTCTLTGGTLNTGTGIFTIACQVTGAGDLTVGSGTLALSYVGDPIDITGSFDATSGTTSYYGSGNQTVEGTTYNNLTITGPGGIKTIDGLTTVTNTCTVDSAGNVLASTAEANDFDFNGDVVLDGEIDLSSGADILTMSGSFQDRFGDAGDGYLDIHHADCDVDLDGELDIGTLTMTAGTLSIADDDVTLTSINCSGGTIIYDRGGNQVVEGATYYNLTISGGSGTKTIDGTTTVSNTCTVNSDVTLASTSGNLDFNGNVVLDGTISLTGGADILTMSGSVANSGSGGTLSIGHADSDADLDGEFDIATLTMTDGTVYIADDNPTLATVNCSGGFVKYNCAGNQSIPDGTYYDLYLDGSGTKTLEGSTVVGAAARIQVDASLDLAGYTLSIGSFLSHGSTGTLTSTTAGSTFDNSTLNGYTVKINSGSLNITSLVVDGLNASGFDINGAVTITSFDSIDWQNGDPSGTYLSLCVSTVLTLTDTVWDGHSFDNNCTYNISCEEEGDHVEVTMTNYSGDCAGEDYDSDSPTNGVEILWLGAPSDFAVDARNSNSITWKWTDNSDCEDGFQILDNSSGALVIDDIAADATSTIEGSLSANTQYDRQVRAFADSKTIFSGNSNSISAYTLTGQPTGFALTDCSTTSFSWTCDAPPNAYADSTAIRFEFLAGGDGAENSGWLTTNTHTDDGLTPNTTYTYDAIWRNGDAVEDTPSDNISACTLAAPPQFVDYGNSYTLNADGSSDCYLAWDNGYVTDSPGNPDYTTYYVEADGDFDNDWAIGAVSSYTGTSQSVFWDDWQIHQDTTYYFRIRAQNIYGEYTDWNYTNVKTDTVTTFYWRNGASSDWATHINWWPMPKYMPGVGITVVGDEYNPNRDIVVRHASAGLMPTIGSDNLCVNDVLINSGNSVTAGSGTLYITGEVTDAGDLITGSGTLALSYVGDPIQITGTFTATSGTVLYNGSGAQTVEGTTYNALTIDGSGTKTVDGTGGTVNNTCTLSGGTLNTGTGTFTVGCQITGAGNLTVGSGSLHLNYVGDPINITGSFDATSGTTYYSGSGAQTVEGTTYNALISNGTGTKTFDGDGAVTSTCAINTGTLNTGTGTLSIACQITGPGDLTVGSGTLQLSYVGDPISIGGTFTATSGTTSYNGGGDQTVEGTIYNALTIDGSGTKTVDGSGTVNNTCMLTSGTLNTGTGTFTILCQVTGAGDLTVGSGLLRLYYLGDPIDTTGSFDATSGTTSYRGEGSQTIEDTTYNNLTLSTSGFKSITGATTVSSTLSITDTAILYLDGYKLSIGSDIAMSSGMIIANSSGCEFENSSSGFMVNVTGGMFDAILDITSLTVDGLNASGFNIDGTVTISNFDNITWQNGDPSGMYLYLGSSDSITLTDNTWDGHSFDNNCTTNISCYAGGTHKTVTMTDYSGEGAGESLDSDSASAGVEIVWGSSLQPTDFEGNTYSSTTINWDWTDNSDEEEGFQIIDCADQTVEIDDIAADATGTVETGLSPDTTYSRQVRAFSDSKTTFSGNSNSVSVCTLAAPPQFVDHGNTWTVNDDGTLDGYFDWDNGYQTDPPGNPGYTTYVFEVDGDFDNDWGSGATEYYRGPNTYIYYPDYNFPQNTTYYVRVKAININGEDSAWDYCNSCTPTATTFHWRGTTNTNWATPSNWQPRPKLLPGSIWTVVGDGNNSNLDILIESGGNMPSVGSDDLCVKEVVINSGNTLSLGSGTFHSTNIISGSGTMYDSAGTLALDYIGEPLSSGLTFGTAGGTTLYNGSGNQTIKEMSYWNLSFNGSGNKVLIGDSAAKETITISGSANFDLAGYTFSLGNDLAMTAGTLTATSSGSTLDNQASGGFEVNITGGTVNISSLTVDGLNSSGFNIVGTVTITSFDGIDWQNGDPSGTYLTLGNSDNLTLTDSVWDGHSFDSNCTYNISCEASGSHVAVTMTEYSGDCAGEDYDSDSPTNGVEIFWLNAPSSFAVSSRNSNSITWDWDDNSSSEEGFQILDNSSGALVIDDIAADATSTIDSGLSANTQYSRQVRAFADSKTIFTDNSNSITAYTLTGQPTGFALTGCSTSSLSWTCDAPPNAYSDSTAIRFEFLAGGSGAENSGWLTTNTHTDDGLTPNTTYTYDAIWRNGDAVEDTPSDNISVCTLAAVPSMDNTSATFTDATSSRIKVSVGLNSNSNGTMMELFVAYGNSSMPTGDWWSAGEQTDLYEWQISNIVPDTSYWFKAHARNYVGIYTSNCSLCVWSTGSQPPYDVRIKDEDQNHVLNNTDPVIDWIFTGGDNQYAYHVEVWDNFFCNNTEMWDSGTVYDNDSEATYDGTTLDDNERYWMRVKTKTETGNWSDWADGTFRMNEEPNAPSLENGSDDLWPVISFERGYDNNGDSLQHIMEVANNEVFNSTTIIYSANTDTSITGWEYSFDNGDTWLDYPAGGVPGNGSDSTWLGRHAVQSELTYGTRYVRIFANDGFENSSASNTGYYDLSNAIDISGYVHYENGDTIDSQGNIKLVINGIENATDTSDGDGKFEFTCDDLSMNDKILIYISDATYQGAIVSLFGGDNLTDLMNITCTEIALRCDNGGWLTSDLVNSSLVTGDSNLPISWNSSEARLDYDSDFLVRMLGQYKADLDELHGETFIDSSGTMRIESVEIEFTDNWTVDEDATLNMFGNVTDISTSGTPAIEINGTWSLCEGTFLTVRGDTDLNVGQYGLLRVLGTPDSPATITGNASDAAFDFNAEGALEMCNFELLYSSGLKLQQDNAALIYSLNHGKFEVPTRGDSDYCVLLDIAGNSTVISTYNLTFEGVQNQDNNVQTGSSNKQDMFCYHYGGSIGNETYEYEQYDGTITWVAAPPVQIEAQYGNEMVLLTWENCQENSGGYTYKVYRQEGESTPALAGSTTYNYYRDESRTNDTEYTYWIEGVSGGSGNSIEISSTPRNALIQCIAPDWSDNATDEVPLVILGNGTHFTDAAKITITLQDGASINATATNVVVISESLLTAELNCSTLTPYEYTLHVKTEDVLEHGTYSGYWENVSETFTVTDTADTTAPSISFTSPTEDEDTSGSFVITVSYGDADADCSSLEVTCSVPVYVNSTEVSIGTNLTTYFDNVLSTEANWTVPMNSSHYFLHGKNLLHARIQDDSGNWGDWTHRSFNVEGGNSSTVFTTATLRQGDTNVLVRFTGSGLKDADTGDFGDNITAVVDDSKQNYVDYYVTVAYCAAVGYRKVSFYDGSDYFYGTILVEPLSNDSLTKAALQGPPINAPMGGVGVLLNSGEFVDAFTDFSLPGRMMGVSWTRVYRSGITYNGPMGRKWDFNYNQRIENPDDDTLVWYHMGRADVFTENASDIHLYEPPGGFYANIVRDTANNEYVMTSRNGFKSHFIKSTDYRYEGKLKYLEDRNGNDIGRQYSIYYTNAADGDSVDEGRIKVIEDFSGRRFKFGYGDNGTLVTATGPAVTGTPTGNDFADGKTYWYAYNSSDLTIIEKAFPSEYAANPSDPTPYLVNTYTSGKVTTQQLGTSGQDIEIRYDSTSYDCANIIDRKGYRTKITWNSDGVTTGTERFTGTWYFSGDTPTADQPRLRDGDPDSYVTTFEYLTTPAYEIYSTTLPRGNRIYNIYDNNNTDYPLSKGNVIEVKRMKAAGHSGPASISTTTVYDNTFNLPIKITDALGYDSYLEYDHISYSSLLSGTAPTEGNLTASYAPEVTIGQPSAQTIVSRTSYNEFGQVVEFTDPVGKSTAYYYYGSGETSPEGTMWQSIDDYGGFNLTSEFVFNCRSATTKVYPPRAFAPSADKEKFASLFTMNTLDQVLISNSAEIDPTKYPDGSGWTAFRPSSITYYDNNNNIYKTEVLNLDHTGQTPTGQVTWISTTTTYNILNYATSMTRDFAAEGSSVTVQATSMMQYDDNYNPVLSTRPMGNKVYTVYDERNMLYAVTGGYESDTPSTVQADYDNNGNTLYSYDGRGNKTTTEYDGYERATKTIDPAGHYSTTTYDDNGQVLTSSSYDNDGTLLAQSISEYDEAGRAWKTELMTVDSDGCDIGDGWRTDITLFDKAGRTIEATDEYGATWFSYYDTAGRRSHTLDPLGNQKRWVYDEAGNTIESWGYDVRQDDGSTETFVIWTDYDRSNHAWRTKLPTATGPAYTYTYFDSRGLVRMTTDAEWRTGKADYNLAGLPVISYQYTGANSSGTEYITEQVYDCNSRLTDVIDANGKRTTFGYDAQGRRIRVSYPTAGDLIYGYDEAGNRIYTRKYDGTEIHDTYDERSLLVHRHVDYYRAMPTGNPDIRWTVEESYAYDGFARLVMAANFDQDNNPITHQAYTWNSFGASESASQLIAGPSGYEPRTYLTEARYDIKGYRTHLTLPQIGGVAERTTEYVPDILGRTSRVLIEGQLPMEFKYAGSRPIERVAGDGVITKWDYELAICACYWNNRLSQVRHYRPDGTTMIRGYAYGFDLSGMPLYRADLHNATDTSTEEQMLATSPGDCWEYDGLNRLITEYRGADNVSETFDDPPTLYNVRLDYTLDGVGNRQKVEWSLPGESPYNTVDYTANSLNQYTFIDDNGSGISQTYTDDLNVSFDGEFYRVYDYKGQLLAVDNTSDSFPSPEGLYAYDCHNRRVRKSGSVNDRIFEPFSDVSGCATGSQYAVGEIGRTAGGVNTVADTWNMPDATIISGSMGVSDGIATPNWPSSNGLRDSTSVFRTERTGLSSEIPMVHNDLLITDGTSTVTTVVYADTASVGSEIASFTCGAFGDNSTVVGNIENPYFYKGYEYDIETGDYYCWNRYYQPDSGAWLQVGLIPDFFESYFYCGNNPVNFNDPVGYKEQHKMLKITTANIGNSYASEFWKYKEPWMKLGSEGVHDFHIEKHANRNRIQRDIQGTDKSDVWVYLGHGTKDAKDTYITEENKNLIAGTTIAGWVVGRTEGMVLLVACESAALKSSFNARAFGGVLGSYSTGQTVGSATDGLDALILNKATLKEAQGKFHAWQKYSFSYNQSYEDYNIIELLDAP
ncbi:MAG: glycoside hydrolase family 78 protein [Planctomycetota bacterium]|jgi:RHS repeat-associated protein